MNTGERIEEQGFCYDPDFPPEVPEGLPLRAAKPTAPQAAPVRRALRACAAAVSKRNRSS
jgi:hypothetical protein